MTNYMANGDVSPKFVDANDQEQTYTNNVDGNEQTQIYLT